MTIKPGQILVKFKEDEQALHQAELERERQAKVETRKLSARQNAAKALAEAVAKQTKSLMEENARIQAEKDQLQTRLRGGGGTSQSSASATSVKQVTEQFHSPSNLAATLPAVKSNTVHDNRVDAMAADISNLKDLVVQLLNSKTSDVAVWSSLITPSSAAPDLSLHCSGFSRPSIKSRRRQKAFTNNSENCCRCKGDKGNRNDTCG